MQLKKRILVVDDERDLVHFIKIRLEDAGYEVFVAYNGQDGLQVAEKEMPDLIILDLMMPKMDGQEVFRLLKANDELMAIPVLILTAGKREKDRVLPEGFGAEAFVTKPFDTNELMYKIRHLLGEGKKNTSVGIK